MKKKPRLLLLSDLWGKGKSDWVRIYYEILESVFDIQYYDCCELGNIDTTDFNEENIHNQFVESGIQIAVKRLLDLEKGKVSILAFSIGGIIAWKAGLKGLKIENLYAISSTRLRYETQKPNCMTKLYYGENDGYIPVPVWFEMMADSCEIVKDGDHLIYMDEKFSEKVCYEIKMYSQRGA